MIFLFSHSPVTNPMSLYWGVSDFKSSISHTPHPLSPPSSGNASVFELITRFFPCLVSNHNERLLLLIPSVG